MHLSSHLTVKLQQRTIYSIYTDVGHAVLGQSFSF